MTKCKLVESSLSCYAVVFAQCYLLRFLRDPEVQIYRGNYIEHYAKSDLKLDGSLSRDVMPNGYKTLAFVWTCTAEKSPSFCDGFQSMGKFFRYYRLMRIRENAVFYIAVRNCNDAVSTIYS